LPSEDCVGKTRCLTSMVDIHLRIDNSQVLALSIPFNDIQRLSIRPLKWLRFVTFTVCGACGDLSATPDGPAVDYDSIALGSEDYYYTPQGDASWVSTCGSLLIHCCVVIGDYHLVDYQTLNDRITSSEQTTRRSDFRRSIIQRNGEFCVVTRTLGIYCDAAHIIPRSKGDEVLFKIDSCHPLTKSSHSTSP
jgi:hypothetical protein